MKTVCVCALVLLSLPLALAANKAAPVPGRTGGFGGPTCHACHQNNPLDGGGGELSLIGVPERYMPGKVYRITVRMTRSGLERGGFSLASRFTQGRAAKRQAGEWQTRDPGLSMHTHAQTGVRYLQHSESGSLAEKSGVLEWQVNWVAPRAAGPVQFNVSAVAANDDRSPLGDFVYVREALVSPQR